MNEFIARFRDSLSGTLVGFDRLVFRGNLALLHEAGMKGFLYTNHVPWKDYAGYVASTSQRVKLASLAAMEKAGRPTRYLSKGGLSKEQLAREIALHDRIHSGPICAFTAVEPCFTWRVVGNRQTQKLHLQRARRQCLYVYHYWIDERFGFMTARLQTWFPLPVMST